MFHIFIKIEKNNLLFKDKLLSLQSVKLMHLDVQKIILEK